MTAISRRDLGKAQDSAQAYRIPFAFGSSAELCCSPEVDAVFVAKPNACHLEDVLLALECGKPVLCEKPMGVNAQQCKEMVEAARRAGLLLRVAQVFRFAETTIRMRKRLESGQIRNPVFARCEFSYNGIHIRVNAELERLGT